ncbi:adenylyltransferase [Fimicolochytrium jonesii]|uniref:adenylyltransferase n=1 Tax=Fimicolochytrium jonesii TaxID=1396493 RepID=UPI0022FEE538|nr:adenylyltransferase [Fimicolochytrium jonesii]KAI8824822.1 adenylyltransferase [Fimicolochytrium jonesii]
MADPTALAAEVARLQKENDELRRQLGAAATPPTHSQPSAHTPPNLPPHPQRDRLNNAEIARFSRQLLMPEIGVKGQLGIRNASVLVVGAGGLGAPAAMYLAAAGIGRLGIVDYDDVEASNLQRQIIHDETKVGVLKAESARETIQRLSSLCDCVPYNVLLESSNALDIIKPYDYVLDATDNVATRYLLNDACVLLGKPLISGSALKMDGQLTVYNLDGGPCYRCLFPKPPPAETVTNCSDGGVLGVVPGIIGCLQALEVIKIASGIGATYSQRLLILDAVLGTFRTIRLRGRSPTCAACGENPSITELIDYVQFCGAGPHDKAPNHQIIAAAERVSCQAYASVMQQATPHVLLDTRPPGEFEICALPNSMNIPFTDLAKRIPDIQQAANRPENAAFALPIYIICRRGNDSQLAVQKLKQEGFQDVKDIVGGLTAWTREVDGAFPVY